MPLDLKTNLNIPRRYILAITGASGMVYALKFLNYLLKAELEVHLVISRHAKIILQKEMGLENNYFQQVLCGNILKLHDEHYDLLIEI